MVASTTCVEALSSYLHSITDIKRLCRLETLSLAHNALNVAAFGHSCPLDGLVSLKKLDLSRNSLTCVPFVVGNLQWYDYYTCITVMGLSETNNWFSLQLGSFDLSG